MNTHPSPLASDFAPGGSPLSPAARPNLEFIVLGALAVLLVGVLASVAYRLNMIHWTIPFLRQTGLLVWIDAMALAIAVTALLAGRKFRQAWRRSLTRTAPVWAMLGVSIALGGWIGRRGYVALNEFRPRDVKLDLPSLSGPIPACCNHGTTTRAERLQADIREVVLETLEAIAPGFQA